MANKNLNISDDILIKVDQNNLIYVDPNSVLSNGIIESRSVEPENLVMYVNLEAELIPRTSLISSDTQNNVMSIAKGMVNFMKNADGRDYDTMWTETFVGNNQRTTTLKNDSTTQTFGIDNISIKIMGANFIPRVDIKFIDVRGKTLFESPSNSPYAAFFHIPWPIFYLTVKGYYGKAIKYRLHLVKFNSKFNANTGNFEIDCNFVGSTYAYLADISLEWILNAAYFYPSQSTESGTYNEKDDQTEKIIIKTTKGFEVLRSVYQEYIDKGYLQKDFPVRTLREVIVVAGRLAQILEKKVFSEIISHHALAGIKEFEEAVVEFKKLASIFTDRYLSKTNYFSIPGQPPRKDPITGENENIRWYTLSGSYKGSADPINFFEKMITTQVTKLENNYAFGVNSKSKETDKKILISPISCAGLNDPKKFYTTYNEVKGFDKDGLFDQIDLLWKEYTDKEGKVEDDVEKIMNDIIEKDKEFGIGFQPTIRNIVAILLANAETYIRLMKDVHNKAFERAEERKKIFDEQSSRATGISTDGGKTIYPWPEVKITTFGGKEMVLVYPGSREMEEKLRSNDKNLWPEVEFVENFYSIATKINDNLVNKEGDVENVHYVFGSSSDMTKKDISVLTNMIDNIPYTNKSINSVLYEMYERAKYTTSISPFDTGSILELADVEYSNLKKQISHDVNIVNTLKRNVKNYDNLISQLNLNIARQPYYLDQIPTTDYILDAIDSDFSVKKHELLIGNTDNNNNDFLKLNKFLENYQAESYRKNIYPFNSSTYKSYNDFDSNSLKLNRILQINAPLDFIASPLDAEMWVKDDYKSNMFTNKIKIGNINKHILNTPYFHKQLYNDFIKTQSIEKYVGSAYLLLNSLPFKDLDDTIVSEKSIEIGNYDGTLISTMFREIGASHYVPYHLMLKWGSIYHRYKKYINEGVDIINNVNQQIDGSLFFDNDTNLTFVTIPDESSPTHDIKTVTRSNESDIGFHPYYENIFHQIVNGYGFLNSDSMVSSYSDGISNEKIRLAYTTPIDANAWSSFIDNSKFDSSDSRYTLLPTNGYSSVNGNDFDLAEQENFRILWGVETGSEPGESLIDYTQYDFPTYNEYFKDVDEEYSLSTNYRKVIDLIATFKPDILDTFESAFLDFASEKLNELSVYKPYDVMYGKFQDFLKEIVSVEKNSNDPSVNRDLLTSIKSTQLIRLTDLTTAMLLNDNLIKITISNPREYNNHLFGGFTNVGVENFSVNSFDASQMTPENLKNIELYLGEDMDEYYSDFFSTNNIELTADNIKQFRPIIYMYAGLRANGENISNSEFVEYIKDNVINSPSTTIDSSTIKSPDNRLRDFMGHVIGKIQSDLQSEEEKEFSTIVRGFNDDPTLKLETYNNFKSFNDKWTAGNSIGQRLLIEEFLFLDRANKDIGDKVFLNLEKMVRLGLKQNAKINLFSAISLLVQDTGFDIRPLPAYVNFYGTSINDPNRIIPSKDVARTMFGSFLDVDYQQASPAIILQYVGPSSRHPEMEDIAKNKYLFDNDGFDISNSHNNPVVVSAEAFAATDFSKSNRVVAFEVSFGDQNQSIFKGIELDQATLRNTSESFYVLENLGKSGGGDSVAQVDIGLWNIYRQASYQCTVTCMGNVMIQPTMYFYLKNVPLFRGSYWITEVTHNISVRGIETSFKGTRIPQRALPDVRYSFLSSYRPLFDKIVKDAIVKVRDESKEVTAGDASTSEGSSMDKLLPGETITNSQSITPYGIPYNGYGGELDIYEVEYNGEKWLKAKVIQMGGENNPIPLDTSMSVASRTILAGNVTWSDVYDRDIYETKFDLEYLPRGLSILTDTYKITEFLNPNSKDGKTVSVETIMDHSAKDYQGPVNVGPQIDGYGIGLSKSIMKKLGIQDNDVVFFRLK